LVRKPEWRLLRKPRHRWEDNIIIDPMEIEWESLDWMHLTQLREQWWVLVKIVMNLWVP